MPDLQIESPEGEIVPLEVETPESREAEPAPAAHVEAEITDTAGRKTTMVPLPELLDERRERRAVTDENKALRTQLDDLKRQTADLASMRAELAALKPKPEAVPDVSEEEAEATAIRYGLYNLEGKPDVKLGRAISTDLTSRVDRRAGEIAEAKIAPLRQMSLQQQATYIENAAIAKVMQEKKATPETLRTLLSNMTMEQKANPDVVSTAILLAQAIDENMGRRPSATPAPPAREVPDVIHTENTNRRLAPGPLSDLEARAAKDAGMTGDQWKKHTDTFKPGVSNRLE